MCGDTLPVRILRTVALVQGLERKRREAESSHTKNKASPFNYSPARSSKNIPECYRFKHSERDITDDCLLTDIKKGEKVRRARCRLNEDLVSREEEARRWAEEDGSCVSKELPSFSPFNNRDSTINNSKGRKSISFDDLSSTRGFQWEKEEDAVESLDERVITVQRPHPTTLPRHNHRRLFINHSKSKQRNISSFRGEQGENDLFLLLEKGSIPLRMVDTKANSAEEMELSSYASRLPLESLSQLLTHRHRSRCNRLHHVLNYYNNNCCNNYEPRKLWERGLPVFAVADATPQVMDLDLKQASSHVTRCTHDRGVVVI